LTPFAALFEKYWGPQTVAYYGDRQEGDLPANVEFRRVPCYSEGVWPWQHWFGNGLRSIMDDLTAFLVAIFLPDHWLTEPVDREGVTKLARWMDRRGNVLRGNLTRGTCLEEHGRYQGTEDGLEIVSIPPTDIHCGLMGGLTFAPAIWNRALLRDVLEPNWTLHACERVGTQRFGVKWYPDIFCVGTRPGLLSRAHGLGHARPKVASLEGLAEEDREIVKRSLPEGWTWIN
jgi:hypothetical protein